MTIYLYVKTHNKTGLKYFGKTKAKDPHRYTGSGIEWKLHLREHGKDYTTEIIKVCKDKKELREWGIYYSNLWNIVESSDWANLKIEVGDGGELTELTKNKISIANAGRHQSIESNLKRSSSLKGKKVSEETKQKISEANKGNKGRLGIQHTELTKQKISEANKGNKPMLGKKHSEETKRKMRESFLKRHQQKENM